MTWELAIERFNNMHRCITAKLGEEENTVIIEGVFATHTYHFESAEDFDDWGVYEVTYD